VYGNQGFMEFDGADDKVVIGARQLGGAFTIAAWIRWSQNPTLWRSGIGVAEVRPPSDSEWGYRTWVQWFVEDVTSSSPACSIQMRHNVEGGDHDYRAGTCTSTSMYHPDGEWHHYAITVETTTWSTVSPISSVKMYADGVLQDTCDSIAKRFEHDTWEVSVGYAEYAGRFTGGMANFRVYPSAIDVAAIKTIASTEVFPPLPSSPPPLPPPFPPPPRPPIASHDTIFMLTGDAKAVVASTLPSTSTPTETAIVSGSPVYGSQGFMDFDGADDKVVIGARQPGGAFTIAAWIRWSQNPTLGQIGIGVAEVRPPSDSEWGYRTWVQWFIEDVTSSSPACNIQMRHNVEGGDHAYRARTCTSTSMYHPDGEWHHYAITVETTTWSTESPVSSIKMYADGVLQDTCDSIDKRFEHDTYEVSIGYAEYAGRFTGGMANLRVYPYGMDAAAITTISSSNPSTDASPIASPPPPGPPPRRSPPPPSSPSTPCASDGSCPPTPPSALSSFSTVAMKGDLSAVYEGAVALGTKAVAYTRSHVSST